MVQTNLDFIGVLLDVLREKDAGALPPGRRHLGRELWFGHWTVVQYARDTRCDDVRIDDVR
jgi:hypothetical protein